MSRTPKGPRDLEAIERAEAKRARRRARNRAHWFPEREGRVTLTKLNMWSAPGWERIRDLVSAKIITPDEKLEAYVRQATSLPPRGANLEVGPGGVRAWEPLSLGADGRVTSSPWGRGRE